MEIKLFFLLAKPKFFFSGPVNSTLLVPKGGFLNHVMKRAPDSEEKYNDSEESGDESVED